MDLDHSWSAGFVLAFISALLNQAVVEFIIIFNVITMGSIRNLSSRFVSRTNSNDHKGKDEIRHRK